MADFAGKPVHAWIVWEPVLATDWGAPSTASLKRTPDLRVAQIWDKARLISRAMGEHNDDSIVWDYIAVYPPGATWNQKPPEALYGNGPVVDVIDPARKAIAQSLAAPNSRIPEFQHSPLTQ